MVAVKPAQTVDVIVTHNHDKQTNSKSLVHTLPSSNPTIAICCMPFMAANTSPIIQHVARQYTWQFAWVRGCPQSVHAAVPPLWLTVDSFASRRGGTLTMRLCCVSARFPLIVSAAMETGMMSWVPFSAIRMIEHLTSALLARAKSAYAFPRGKCSVNMYKKLQNVLLWTK